MILYHFTAAHLVPHVRRMGLTKGMLPWNLERDGTCQLRRGFQWLTTNPSFDQAWCLNGMLPFPKNAFRITVHVPKPHERRVFRWSELVRRCQPDSAEELNRTGGDTENWCLYVGAIPPSWFLEVTKNGNDLIIGSQAIPQG